MYIRWTSFKCPFCSTTWDSRIVSAPRPDKESRTCSSCSREFRTHDIEWLHMTTKQKLGYVLNEWMIAWLLFYAMVVAIPIVGIATAKSVTDALDAAEFFVVGTAIMLGPFALVKWLTIRRSKRRTLENALTSTHPTG
jgi:sensor c-di-GMP phosphodiesterase-like protein